MSNQSDFFKGKLVRLASSRPDDGENSAKWAEDAQFWRNMDTDFALPKTLEDMGRAIDRENHAVTFRLRTIAEDKLIGFVAIHGIEWNNQTGLLAIGIGDPFFRGKGYGQDALQLILRYAFFELNLHRVGLDVNSNNPRAIRAYEKAGFKHEGEMREAGYRDGKRYNRVIMGILRDEWLQQKSEELS